MRPLKRPEGLTRLVSKRLRAEQAKVDSSNDSKAYVDGRWPQVRKLKWFKTGPEKLLREAAGPGEYCMYCSAGEGSQVEHFRPKSLFPERGFLWNNFLWVCGKCNVEKGNRFPPVNYPGETLLNPMDDNVWDHLRLNPYMMFSGTVSRTTGVIDRRGESTLEVLKLNRQPLVERRQSAYRKLENWAKTALRQLKAGEVSLSEVAKMKQDWLHYHQPDVAHYFLKGPGRTREPFYSLVQQLAES